MFSSPTTSRPVAVVPATGREVVDRAGGDPRAGLHDAAAVNERPPVSFPPDDAVAVGQRRLAADLDAREFVDPAVFGDTPTLVGMMRAAAAAACSDRPASVCALSATLFCPVVRGGGDLIGRWRGHRTAIVGEASATLPGADDIRASAEWRDFSAYAIANGPSD